MSTDMSTEPGTKQRSKPNKASDAPARGAMSRKPGPSAGRPSANQHSARGTKARTKAGPAAQHAKRRFSRLLLGIFTVLAVLAGVLAAADVAKLPHPNATSALEHAAGTAGFAVYSLERNTDLGSDGRKKPDVIRGKNLSSGSQETTIVTAPRIQEFVALSGALALVTINDDATSSLEFVSLAGGAPTTVGLPKRGSVEKLRVAGSTSLVGFSFTSSPASDGYWKRLFVYDTSRPATPPREVRGISGPISVADWSFVPGTSSIVAQTDDHSMFLIDTFGSGRVTPLGMHAGLLGFVPGTQDLIVEDRPADPAKDRALTSSIDLADGSVKPLDLPVDARPSGSYAGKPVVLDEAGRFAQVVSEFTAGKESAVLNMVDRGSTRLLYRPDKAFARILSVCPSPNGQYLAVETTSPNLLSDHYPNVPGWLPSRTEIVDIGSGAGVADLPGFLPSWCR